MKGTSVSPAKRTLFRKRCDGQLLLLAVLLLASVFANADDPQSDRKPAQAVEVNDAKAAAVPTVKPADPAKPSEDFNHWLVSGVLSPLDWWIPGKFGIQFAYIPNPSQAIEIEYLRGSFGFALLGEDLGEALEQRLTAQSRYFLTESFNYHAGIHYNYFEVKLKDKYINNVPVNPDNEDYTLVELATVGITLGVGHRWFLDNGMEIGADWLQLQMPLIRIHQHSPILDLSGDDQTRDAVSESIRRMRDNPRFALIKFQAGISF